MMDLTTIVGCHSSIPCVLAQSVEPFAEIPWGAWFLLGLVVDVLATICVFSSLPSERGRP